MRDSTGKEALLAAILAALILSAFTVHAGRDTVDKLLALATLVEEAVRIGDMKAAESLSLSLYNEVLHVEPGLLRDNPALAERIAADAAVKSEYPYVDTRRYVTAAIRLMGYDVFMQYQAYKLLNPLLASRESLEALLESVERMSRNASLPTPGFVQQQAGESTGATPGMQPSGVEGGGVGPTVEYRGGEAETTAETDVMKRIIEALSSVSGGMSSPGSLEVPSINIPWSASPPRLAAPSITSLASAAPGVSLPSPLVLVVPAVIAAAVAAVILLAPRLRRSLVVRRVERLLQPGRSVPRHPVIQEFEALLYMLEGVCGARRAYETAREYGARIEPEEARRLYSEACRVYEAVRYGGLDGDAGVVRRVRERLASIACR